MKLQILALPLLVVLAVPAVAEDEPYEPQRTEWGDPDLRGRWPIDYLAQTPRQRPPQFGTRKELTEEEYQAAVAQAKALDQRYELENRADIMGMGHWSERGMPLRVTSLMTEPEDGRLPPMTEEGAHRAAAMRSSWNLEEFNWVDDFNTFDRCITRGMPGSMLPGVYNSGIRVFQAPGYVAIQLEMVHETRIIPLDGRDAPPAQVKDWLGVSRGHWEGDTLVIETSNFVAGNSLGNSGNSPNPVPNSEEMKIVEKLTATGPDTIRYEVWVDDPTVLTEPFKYELPWVRNDNYEIYEYACHEGNVQIRGYIEGTGTSPSVVAKREAALGGRDAGQ